MSEYATVEVVFHDGKTWTDKFTTNEEADEAFEEYKTFLMGIAQKISLKRLPPKDL